MHPVKAPPKAHLHKLGALSLSFLSSAAMILGLFVALVSPTQAREGNSIENEATLHVEAAANQQVLSLLNELEPLSLEWENHWFDGDGASFARLTAVTVRNSNEIWFGGNAATSGNGSLQTAHYNYATDTWSSNYVINDTSGPSEIRSLAFDENDDLLLATDDGVLKQASGTGTPQAFGTGYLVDDVRTIVVDDSEIWFGTFGGGAVHYTPGSPATWQPYTRTGSGTDQICSNNVYSIAIQGNGNIWFGTDDGFCKLDTNAESNAWTYYLHGSDIDVSDLALDAEGNIWVVRPGFGISVLSPSESWTHYTEANSGLTDEGSVWSITIDSTQRKWIGFQGYGVDVIAPDNENWLNFSENTEDNRIAGDIVNDIVEARNGDIWLAIEPNTFSEFASQGVTAISGLTATNSSPTQSGATTTFTATVTYGSGVAYTWDFGDGTAPATGVTATHAYQTAGNYTAVVTASNQVNQVTATTTVTINSGSADLIVEKKGPAEVAAGGILIYEITIANQGTSPATEIVLTDTDLPPL